MSGNQFDSLLKRLRATRERQAGILAQTDKDLGELEKLIATPTPIENAIERDKAGRR